MTEPIEKERGKHKDIRGIVISRIWAYATGMMVVSVLFGGPGRDWRIILLPATVASSAAISTIAVWCIPNRRYRRSQGPHLLPEQAQELERRIANLEAIACNQDLDWQYRVKQLEQAAINDQPQRP